MAELMQAFARIADELHDIALIGDGAGGFRLPDGTPVCLQGDILQVGARSYLVALVRDGDRLWVHLNGRAHEIIWQDAVMRYAAEQGDEATADHARAPMPGIVQSVTVTPGESVAAGDIMMIIESMKLETAINAPRDGIIETVYLGVGATFEREALLVSLVPTS
jgi:acetyl/propionyl-CoA carboxylase alpha subunit